MDEGFENYAQLSNYDLGGAGVPNSEAIASFLLDRYIDRLVACVSLYLQNQTWHFDAWNCDCGSGYVLGWKGGGGGICTYGAS